ncbi:MAG: hypothetical protein JJU13_04870 [Balneolaceae bacterium]|nr:hypothetical protein [Balneolaceae bacterium]
MKTKAREEIIKWISTTTDEELLETLLLIKESSGSADWFDDLSDTEKRSVKKGIADHESGNTLSSEDFWKTVSVKK